MKTRGNLTPHTWQTLLQRTDLTMTSVAPTQEEEGGECYICFGTESGKTIQPCSTCKGSCSTVHVGCWVVYIRTSTTSACAVCRTPFRLEEKHSDDNYVVDARAVQGNNGDERAPLRNVGAVWIFLCFVVLMLIFQPGFTPQLVDILFILFPRLHSTVDSLLCGMRWLCGGSF